MYTKFGSVQKGKPATLRDSHHLTKYTWSSINAKDEEVTACYQDKDDSMMESVAPTLTCNPYPLELPHSAPEYPSLSGFILMS
jgi:hypothetical protein